MRFIRTAFAVAVAALVGLLAAPATDAEAAWIESAPPGNITVVQDLSEPCGDTTGADIIVTIDGGAPDTMYTAEIKDVTGFRARPTATATWSCA